MEDILETFRDYYKSPAVRARILEFLGSGRDGDFTCEYITADGLGPPQRRAIVPGELFARLDEGLDICRSLWDRQSLIAHLDVEYVNFDFPADPYLDPARAFGLQEPVEEALRRILDRCGLRPLQILSGRGHHFVWRIDRCSPVFTELCAMGRATQLNDSAHLRRRDGLDLPSTNAAFAGLGLLMEFLGRLAVEIAEPDSAIPLDLTAVEVGPSQRGREMISIDLSEYGDPLSMRAVRVPFSGYLKPWQQPYAMGRENLTRIGPLVFVPLDGMELAEGLIAMRDPQRAAEVAESVSARIPDMTAPTAWLLDLYRSSGLRRFHEWFYSAQHDDPSRWPQTYDRTPLHDLAEPARSALVWPNDLLLRPAGMKAVTNALLARGWHPRHIAGLIRSKFERDYGWGEEWRDYSPALRADFYTRIFSSLGTSVAPEAGIIRASEVAVRRNGRRTMAPEELAA